MPLDSKWARVPAEDGKASPAQTANTGKKKPAARSEERRSSHGAVKPQEEGKTKDSKRWPRKKGANSSARVNSAGSGGSASSAEQLDSRPSTSGSQSKSRIFDKAAGRGPNPLAVRLGITDESARSKRDGERRAAGKGAAKRASRTNAPAHRQVKGDGRGQAPRPLKDDPATVSELERRIFEQRKLLAMRQHQAEQERLLQDFLCDDFPLEWDENELVGQLDKLATR
ncbi:AGL214Cp [Eremothecium gossypii ATCC 10895]|uniref:AGL214Cp n=1 Tax=Eremothecium gossypii (strain ATCC 10895 / CBS 109.51 / FGSC 9923 / NRRL Y-1056) TaxID=284811 RepID=Q751C0_EREGS|nr:AGL214Cp [Eremothecium gossypii ATCC 10895]AAS54277.2 AGL214Cp [Eremothecium gossypii ATCC 10895]AEY98603.1 FAGL214Cp [Eremothecium gossypii FDAG1]